MVSGKRTAPMSAQRSESLQPAGASDGNTANHAQVGRAGDRAEQARGKLPDRQGRAVAAVGAGSRRLVRWTGSGVGRPLAAVGVGWRAIVRSAGGGLSFTILV